MQVRPHAKRLRGNNPRSRRRELARLYRAAGRPAYDRRLEDLPEFRALQARMAEISNLYGEWEVHV